jgi:hypothetical protein
MNLFRCSVVEIIATENEKFLCVRRESKKGKKLDGSRVSLKCEMRCEARIRISIIENIKISEKTN